MPSDTITVLVTKTAMARHSSFDLVFRILDWISIYSSRNGAWYLYTVTVSLEFQWVPHLYISLLQSPLPKITSTYNLGPGPPPDNPAVRSKVKSTSSLELSRYISPSELFKNLAAQKASLCPPYGYQAPFISTCCQSEPHG